MQPQWKLNDFNDRGELKPPLGFLLSLVYLSRHLIYLILAAVSQFRGAAGQIDTSALALPPAWLLPLSFPSFILFFLVLNRERFGASSWWRVIIKWSKPLLLLIAATQFLFFAGHAT